METDRRPAVMTIPWLIPRRRDGGSDDRLWNPSHRLGGLEVARVVPGTRGRAGGRQGPENGAARNRQGGGAGRPVGEQVRGHHGGHRGEEREGEEGRFHVRSLG